MMQSMTGFGFQEAKIPKLGKVCVELKSTNHKSLEITFRLPEGFSFLEDKIKNEIERRIKRGRVICTINITGGQSRRVFVNKELLDDYTSSIRSIKGALHFKDQISLNAFIALPGVLALSENRNLIRSSWPKIRILASKALESLVLSRTREGQAMSLYLKSRIEELRQNACAAESRFKKAVKSRVERIGSDEEKTNFLKNSDINEEIARLKFHVQSFKKAIIGDAPKGKELDFIAQEIQREANTMGAKSFDPEVSARVIRVKSQAEQIREQLQNVE